MPLLALTVFAATFSLQQPELVTPARQDLEALPSSFMAASRDGRFALVQTRRANAVPGQVGVVDLVLVDRLLGTNQLVNHIGDGLSSADAVARDGVLSDDGRVVLFSSLATNQVPGYDSLGFEQVYRFDATTGAVTPLTRDATNPALGGNGSNAELSISGSGDIAVISTNATNLLAGFIDGNTGEDLFAIDLTTSQVSLLSADASNPNRGAMVSFGSVRFDAIDVDASGQVVTFSTVAVNLVPGFVAGNTTIPNVFLHDRATGSNTLVSRLAGSPVIPVGGVSRGLSPSGRLAYFESSGSILASIPSGNQARQVFVYDALTDVNHLISHSAANATQPANGVTEFLAASDDGSKVLYRTRGNDVLAGVVDQNGGYDAYLYDAIAGAATRLLNHVPGQPLQTPDPQVFPYGLISGDGTHVALVARGESLDPSVTLLEPAVANAYMLDLSGTSRVLITPSVSGLRAGSSEQNDVRFISSDGSVVFHSTEAGNVPEGGAGPGRTAFATTWPGQQTQAILRRAGPASSTPNNGSAIAQTRPTNSTFRQAISDNGQVVALTSEATNLVPGVVRSSTQGSLYVADIATGSTRLVNHIGDHLNTTVGSVSAANVSGDGSTVAFTGSTMSGLLPGPYSPTLDQSVFVYDVSSGVTQLISGSAAQPTNPSNGSSTLLDISRDGRYVIFHTSSTDLLSGVQDLNSRNDIVLVDRLTGTRQMVSRSAQGGRTSNGSSTSARLSPDGTKVYFLSDSSDLVPGFLDGNGNMSDLYSFDVATQAVTLVNHVPGTPTRSSNFGARDPRVGLDGTLVFASSATDLVPGFPSTGVPFVRIYAVDSQGNVRPAITNAGQPGVGLDAEAQISYLSLDGTGLLFTTTATNVVPGFVDMNGSESDLFHVDLITGAARLISGAFGQPNVGSSSLSTGLGLSQNGRRVLWKGFGEDAVLQQGADRFPDAYITDIDTGSVTRLTSDAVAGAVPGADQLDGAMASDGRSVLLTTNRSWLVADDYNVSSDVFRYSLPPACIGISLCDGAVNGTGAAASMCIEGSERAAANAVTVTVTDLPANTFGLFVASMDTGVVVNPGGAAGNLCISGPSLGRYISQLVPANPDGVARLDVNLASIPSANAFTAASPGSTFAWQMWYRDSAAGGNTSAMSEARQVTFR